MRPCYVLMGQPAQLVGRQADTTLDTPHIWRSVIYWQFLHNQYVVHQLDPGISQEVCTMLACRSTYK